jgi:hypothetical protein
MAAIGLKEIVLGLGLEDRKLQEASAFMRAPGIPTTNPATGVYPLQTAVGAAGRGGAYGGGVGAAGAAGAALRLTPSNFSSLVLSADACGALKERALVAGFDRGLIGKTSLSEGQRMLRVPGLAGLDLRVCSTPGFQPYFWEAEAALMEDCLADTQPEQHAAQRKELNTQDAFGDCWMEVRAIAKNPGGFFKKRGGRK